jgi:hypothetical protein
MTCQIKEADRLSKIPQSKDDALEALDFIVSVLKEHEKDLDKLINELATVAEQMGDTGELSNKVEKVEERINVLQKEVTNLISYLSSGMPKEALAAQAKEQIGNVAPIAPVPTVISVVLRCKQWEDFQSLASRAQTLSFNFKEDEKTFQADALKGNQIITYCGAPPKFSSILKAWLSKSLEIPEQNVMEGVLALS